MKLDKKWLGICVVGVAFCLVIFMIVDKKVADNSNNATNPKKVATNGVESAVNGASGSELPDAKRECETIVDRLRSAIQKGDRPRSYAGFVADIAFLLEKTHSNAEIVEMLVERVASDPERKIRMLLSIPLGIYGGEHARSMLENIVLTGNDEELIIVCMRALKAVNPIKASEYIDRSWYGDFVAEIILPLDSFYGNKDVYFKDWTNEVSDLVPGNGSGFSATMVGTNREGHYIHFQSVSAHLGKLFLQFAGDASKPKNARNEAADLLWKIPDELIQEAITTLDKLSSTGEYEIANTLLHRLDSISKPMDEAHSEAAIDVYLRIVENCPRWEAECLVKNAESDLSRLLARPERWELGQQIAARIAEIRKPFYSTFGDSLKVDILGLSPGDVKDASRLWQIQLSLLQESKEADKSLEHYATRLWDMKYNPNRFISDEARSVFTNPAASDSAKHIVVEALEKHGDASDLEFIKSMTENQTDKEMRRHCESAIRQMSERLKK